MNANAEQTQEPPADTLIQVFGRSGIRAWCFSDGVGTDDGWRYAVWFDKNGRVKEKDAYYWYD